MSQTLSTIFFLILPMFVWGLAFTVYKWTNGLPSMFYSDMHLRKGHKEANQSLGWRIHTQQCDHPKFSPIVLPEFGFACTKNNTRINPK